MATTTYEPEFAWIPVLIVLALIAIGATAAFVSSRRRRGAGAEEDAVTQALVGVLEDTLEDLRAEADPRRAVIAAYARLERALAAHGLPRRVSETPEEYLARMFGALEVNQSAVRRLTDLFTRAKFSQHAVDVGMKEEAIDALVYVRDELREARERAEREQGGPDAPDSELLRTGERTA